MAIFSLFKYNQSNRIDVRIGDGTVKITNILTARAMLTSKKKYSGRARNKSGEKIKIGEAIFDSDKNRVASPPAGDAILWGSRESGEKWSLSLGHLTQ